MCPSATGKGEARYDADAFLLLPVRFVSTSHFVVGLDAGGSKTHLLAQCSERSAPIEERGPGANPNRIGLDRAADVLVNLVGDAIRGCSIERLSVCAGVSGAGRTREQEALTEALRAAFSGSDTAVRVEVVHDALIALDAAYDTGSGLIVIAGTGSVVLARTRDGTLLRVGGWGHLLGDPGSGYSIGQAGLQAVAEAYDGGRDTDLRTRLHEHFDIDSRERLIHNVYQEGVSVQAVAPLVIEAAADGDDVAAELLSTQAAGLAEQVAWLVQRDESIAPRITLLGGMVRNDHYARYLHQILHDRFPNWSVDVLEKEPVVGALRRARRLLSEAAG